MGRATNLRREEAFVGKNCDCDGYAVEEEEKKTEAEMDGQNQVQLDREDIIGRIDARPCCLEASNPKHRPHIKVGKYADDGICTGFGLNYICEAQLLDKERTWLQIAGTNLNAL